MTLSRRLAYLLASVLALTGFGALADGHEPAPQPALESFLCNLLRMILLVVLLISVIGFVGELRPVRFGVLVHRAKLVNHK